MHRNFLLLTLVIAVTPGLARGEILVGDNHDYTIHRDIAYFEGDGADPDKHRLDLFIPKGVQDFPVLFFVHGGGWVSGDRWMYPWIGRVFARQGIGTVVISYRLSPQVRHPQHIEDVARAFAWTRRNIASYGGRVDRIFVSGHSAGGHLSALLATDERYLKAHGLSLTDIRGAMPLSGVFRLPSGIMNVAFGSDEKKRTDAAPLSHSTGKKPPFLIAYADSDFPTCDKMSEEMSKALKEGGNEAATLSIAGRNHITVIMTVADEEDALTQAMLRFMAKHSELKLHPKPSKPSS